MLKILLFCIILFCLTSFVKGVPEKICKIFDDVTKPDSCSELTFSIENDQNLNLLSKSELNQSISDEVDKRLYSLKQKLENMTKSLETISQLNKPNSRSPSSCNEMPDGEHTLSSGLKVLCQNGWIVFQQNQQNEITFNKTWNEYKIFFGNFSGNFWLGLDTIHNLTKQRNCKLRVDLWGSSNTHEYVEYSTFYIDNEVLKYTLHVSGYNGTAGDGLIDGNSRSVHNNMPFTTKDRDNDNYPGNKCAHSYENVGWWYNACFQSNLNRPFGNLHWNGGTRTKSAMMVQCP